MTIPSAAQRLIEAALAWADTPRQGSAYEAIRRSATLSAAIDAYRALDPTGSELARLAEIGAAVERLPEEAYLYWYDDQGDVPRTWMVRVPSIQRNRKTYSGSTPDAAITAALGDES